MKMSTTPAPEAWHVLYIDSSHLVSVQISTIECTYIPESQYSKVVIYYTVTLSPEASPMGLWDSLNRCTIFNQPPYSFAACLVRSQLCLFTFSPEVTRSQRLSMIRYTISTPTEIEPSEPSGESYKFDNVLGGALSDGKRQQIWSKTCSKLSKLSCDYNTPMELNLHSPKYLYLHTKFHIDLFSA